MLAVFCMLPAPHPTWHVLSQLVAEVLAVPGWWSRGFLENVSSAFLLMAVRILSFSMGVQQLARGAECLSKTEQKPMSRVWEPATNLCRRSEYLPHFFFLFFKWCWGLNSGSHSCQGRHSTPWATPPAILYVEYSPVGSQILFVGAGFVHRSSWALPPE
jgi:hypothetical protein